MTTLPPESNGDQPQNPQPETAAPAQPEAPAHWSTEPPTQPAAPESPASPATSAAEQLPTTPPPASEPPLAAPGYHTPQQPAPAQQPSYQAPPAGAGQVPPAAPPAGGYQQPAAAATSDPVSNLTLNYWLSVFFAWLPALIFWVIEKDKGNQRATQLHVANLNFSLLRTAVWLVTVIFGGIPAIGWLIALLLGIGSIVLFVFHIIAATKAAEAYRTGAPADPFIFNVPLIKA